MTTMQWLTSLLIVSLALGVVKAEEDSLEATNVVLFLFFGLGMGVLVMQVLSYYGEPVPYTVLVFVMGAFFSLCTSNEGK